MPRNSRMAWAIRQDSISNKKNKRDYGSSPNMRTSSLILKPMQNGSDGEAERQTVPSLWPANLAYLVRKPRLTHEMESTQGIA